MELLGIELLLWAGLVFFLWALKDGLGRVEDEIDERELQPQQSAPVRLHYDSPEKVIEAIGTYRDAQIYQYAVINGEQYQFDHIVPPENAMPLRESERCLAPGLVYAQCRQA